MTDLEGMRAFGRLYGNDTVHACKRTEAAVFAHVLVFTESLSPDGGNWNSTVAGFVSRSRRRQTEIVSNSAQDVEFVIAVLIRAESEALDAKKRYEQARDKVSQ